MTPIKPQERLKAGALIGAIVLVFGFGAWNLFGPKGGGSTTASPVAGTTPATGPLASTGTPAPAGASAGTAAGPVVGDAGDGTVLVTPQRPTVRPDLDSNPFRPVADPAAKPAPAPPAAVAGTATRPAAPPSGATASPRRAAPVTVTARTARPFPRVTPSLPQVAPAPLPVIPAPRPPASLGAPVVVLPRQPLQLVGVVWGTQPVAMIRVGVQEFFARQGQRVAGYRVHRIGAEEVALQSDRKVQLVLRVGDPPLGGSSAEAASGAPAAPTPVGFKEAPAAVEPVPVMVAPPSPALDVPASGRPVAATTFLPENTLPDGPVPASVPPAVPPAVPDPAPTPESPAPLPAPDAPAALPPALPFPKAPEGEADE